MNIQEQRLHTMLALMLLKYGEGERHSVELSRDLYDQLPDVTGISSHPLPDGSGVVLSMTAEPEQED